MEGHRIKKKIYYHDTDAGGVMYYADYLEHLEEGRFEFCLSRGVNIAELAKQGVIFPVVRMEIDYKSPARYGDIVEVFTRVEKFGFSSVHFIQEIKRDSAVLIKAKMICACVNEALKPQPIPEKIKQALKEPI